jgi:hypothetical protein
MKFKKFFESSDTSGSDIKKDTDYLALSLRKDRIEDFSKNLKQYVDTWSNNPEFMDNINKTFSHSFWVEIVQHTEKIIAFLNLVNFSKKYLTNILHWMLDDVIRGTSLEDNLISPGKSLTRNLDDAKLIFDEFIKKGAEKPNIQKELYSWTPHQIGYFLTHNIMGWGAYTDGDGASYKDKDDVEKKITLLKHLGLIDDDGIKELTKKGEYLENLKKWGSKELMKGHSVESIIEILKKSLKDDSALKPILDHLIHINNQIKFKKLENWIKEKINNTKIKDIISILVNSGWKESSIKTCIHNVLKELGHDNWKIKKLKAWAESELKKGHSLDSIILMAKKHYPSYVSDYLEYLVKDS